MYSQITKRWQILILVIICLVLQPIVANSQSNGEFLAFDWSPDTTKVAISYTNIFEVRDTQTSQVIFSRTNTRTEALAWSNDNTYLAFAPGDNGVVDIIDGSNGGLVTYLEIPIGFIREMKSLSWSPDGTKIAGITQTGSGLATELQLRIWDISTQQPYLTVGKPGASSVIWSPDGNSIAVVISGTPETPAVTEILDIITGDLLYPVNGVAKTWNLDGSQIITTEPLKVNIYASNGNLITMINSNAPSINDIALSSDGSIVASGSWFGYLEVWEVATGQPILTITDLQVVRVAWIPQSNDLLYFVRGDTDDTIHTVSVPIGIACDHDIPAADTATLISTITTANGSGNPTTICLAPDSTYTVTTANNYLNALPYITGDITIEGQNATITRSGTEAFRFFEVETGGKLTLNDLTLSNGDVTGETERGGALMNDGGETILNNVTFNANSGDTGGAIDNEEGTLTINDSTFTDNIGDYGGAIDNDDVATLTISGSTFTTNHAFADGGAIHNDGGTLTVSSTTFTTNTADEYGGAMDNDDGTVTLNGSTFTSNTSDGGGAIRNDGTLTVNAGSAFNSNAATNLGWGGAIYNKSGTTLDINGTDFSGNTAADMGGAIRNQGTVTITAATFNENAAAEYGGAIYNTGGTLNLSGVQLTDNTATTYDAGGIYGNSSSSLTITDSTLNGNDSGRRGGGIWSSGTASLTNVHLTNNSATVEGGGVYGSSSAIISAGNSCISGNSSRAVYSASSATQNFENNWWGATNGPSGSGSGSGDAVNSKIDFTPFITTSCPLP